MDHAWDRMILQYGDSTTSPINRQFQLADKEALQAEKKGSPKVMAETNAFRPSEKTNKGEALK